MDSEKRNSIMQYLSDWQNDSYELVETESDIKIFNTVGLIIGMANGGLFDFSKSHQFITEVLTLTEEEKKKMYRIIIDAYTYKGDDEK